MSGASRAGTGKAQVRHFVVMSTEEPPETAPEILASEKSSRLAAVMAATSLSLQAGFAEIKAAFTHNTTKGAGGEALVAEFLQTRLPEQIGCSAGQVIDSSGAVSKQVDVVLYDRSRTPMLFRSPNGLDQLIPVEGVLCVIEVKTHLTKAMLPGILENCRSVKRLTRTAYFDQPTSPAFRLYDQDWTDFPIYYSVFAAKSDNMYAGSINDMQYDEALHERIDSLCYLDRGSNLNVSMPDMYASPQISATPSSGSGLIDIASDQGLLHWYGALASVMAQAQVRPINILTYMASELQVAGTVPRGKFSEDMAARFRAEIAAANGLDPDVLLRFQAKAPTQRDSYELLRSPGYPLAPEYEEELRPAQEAALVMSFEEWSTRWNITGSSEP